MIRVAKLEDVEEIVRLGYEMHLESRFSCERYDHEKVAKHMASLINGEGVVFVAEHDGGVVGGIACGVTERWFNDTRVAFDYALFVRKGSRNGIIAMKLVSAFTRWASAFGITTVTAGIVTGVHPDATARMYEALGFDRVGLVLEAKV